WPVARLSGYLSTYPTGAQISYNIDGQDYPNTAITPVGQAYWFTFLAKYATKSKVGSAVNTDATAGQLSRQTVFFGCPAWEGYAQGGIQAGDTNTVQPGYGMNPSPTYISGVNGDPAVTLQAVIDPAGGSLGTWWKASKWTRPSERMLVSDSKFWVSTANNVPPV